jgi:hypothetical protein
MGIDVVGIKESVGIAARERLWSHTVGIANSALATHGRDPLTGLPATEEGAPGTGFAGVWGRHHFILTAKHVLEEAQPKDLRFFVRQTGQLRGQQVSEVTMQDAVVAVPLTDPDAAIHRCEGEDIALLTMKPNGLGPNLEFFDVASSWADPSEGEAVFGVGYPVSNSVMFNRQVGTVLQHAVVLTVTPISGVVLPCPTADERRFAITAFDPDRHFLIPYEPATRGKSPQGISGAAVFVGSREERVVWAPRFEFAGICTSCYKHGTVEQIVKASVARQFLREVFGVAEK